MIIKTFQHFCKNGAPLTHAEMFLMGSVIIWILHPSVIIADFSKTAQWTYGTPFIYFLYTWSLCFLNQLEPFHSIRRKNKASFDKNSGYTDKEIKKNLNLRCKWKKTNKIICQYVSVITALAVGLTWWRSWSLDRRHLLGQAERSPSVTHISCY